MALCVGDLVKHLVGKNKEFVSFPQHTKDFLFFFFSFFFFVMDISVVFAESIIKAFILSVFVLAILQFSLN